MLNGYANYQELIGKRVRATRGDSTIVGDITDAYMDWLDIMLPDKVEGMTLSTGWSIEILSEPLPTKPHAIVTNGDGITFYLADHGDSLPWLSGADTIWHSDYEVRRVTPVKVVFEGIDE